LWPDEAFVAHFNDLAADTGAKLRVTEVLGDAVKGADFVYTDVWLSMGGDEADWGRRIELLTPYRVTEAVMAGCDNEYAKFMHCLPAFHDASTEVGADIEKRFGISCMEVTDEVFESAASIVFAQAENRMHTIKAILVATLAG
jgi:ornithine carbamoyltransferase